MKVDYNAPVVLSFTFLSLAVFVLNATLLPGLTEALFVVGPRGSFRWLDPLSYWRLVSHGLGHANLDHFLANFSVILLMGPILEEKFGSTRLLEFMFITLLTTGITNVLFFPTGLLGASGIVFLFIVLGSFANAKPKTVPLTFLLIALLFLVREIVDLMGPEDGVSQTAHLLGGFFGSLFGFRYAHRVGLGRPSATG